METPSPTPPGSADASTISPGSIDQYQLLRELGVGGMGVVWLARDTVLDRQVAIKVLKSGTRDPSSTKRLLREAMSAAKLSHPNVVSVYHVLDRDGQIHIVMELLGRSLADELRDGGRLPWTEATAAIRDAAAGLAAAHAAGLVHRDIKPSNLLRSGQGGIKVADFGLVDSPDSVKLTATGAVLGTLGYMSPEQCRGEKTDSRSDVYALGCTYYHLLTGRPPFEGADRHEVMSRHASGPFPNPKLFVTDLPDGVLHIIETACRKDPRLRYPTAAEMLAELGAALTPSAPAAALSGGRLRIFLSSPGDVAEERVVAKGLIERLANEFADRIAISPIIWEHEPLLAHDTFQSQIPRPSESEIVVCILWSRLGTRLPADISRPDGSRYASGTEYEFEDAVEGRKTNGYPDLLVYRKTAKPMVSLDDDVDLERRREQKKLLDAFEQKWFFHGEDGSLKAAFHTFEKTADFEQVLEQHLRRLIVRRSPVVTERPVAHAKPSWTSGSPFRGLDVFEFEHAPVFVGRTRAIGDVLNALRENAAAGKAFVLVVGVSGGGKSSLARAGVLPVLTQPGVIEGVALWRRAVLKPSDAASPIQSLAAALLRPEALPELGADGTSADQLAEMLRNAPAGAFALIKGGLSQAAAALVREQSLTKQPEARLVIVADQLEELFTLSAVAAAEREAFVAALSSLSRSGKVFVVATLRADFYHRAVELPELVALQDRAGQSTLLLPTPAEIGLMVRLPARAAGLTFEEDSQSGISLEDVLRDAASASPESLPLLQFALEELYQRRTPEGLLTYAAYRELGGVEGALTQRAEAIFASLSPEVQAAFPRVMRGLVHVGEGDAVARHQAALESVAPNSAAKEFVDAFVKARLFTADRTEQAGASVRVTHEALLLNWPRVKDWLKQDRELLILRSRVSAAAARWQAEGRRSDLLLNEGKPLLEAESVAAKLGDELPRTQRAYIAASALRRKRRTALKRSAVAALVLLTLIASLAAGYARRQRSKADANASRAEANARLAATNAAAAQANADRALESQRRALASEKLANERLAAIEMGVGGAVDETTAPQLTTAFRESYAKLNPSVKAMKAGDLSPLSPVLQDPTMKKMEQDIMAILEKANLKDEKATRAMLSPSSVPGLIMMLKDPDDQVRIKALQLVRIMGPDAKAAIPALIEAVRDPDVMVRTVAIGAIGAMGPDAVQALPVLREALSDERMFGMAAAGAAIMIGRLGEPAKPAVPDLIALLRRRGMGGTGGALIAFTELGPVAEDAAPVVIETLKETQDAAVVNLCLSALAAIGPAAKPALPQLLEILKGDDATQRQKSLAVLAKLGPDAEPALPQLIRILRSNDQDCRGWACEVLSNCPSIAKKALPDLVKASNGQEGVLDDAPQGPGKPNEPNKPDEKDPTTSKLMYWGTRALANLDPPEPGAGSTLAARLSSPSTGTRSWAAFGLERMGGKAAAYLPDLRKALEGETDQGNRTSIERAIAKVALTPAEFWYDGSIEPKGVRHWVQADSEHWDSTLPDGSTTRFVVIGPADDGKGTIVQRLPGKDVEVLIPASLDGGTLSTRKTGEKDWQTMATVRAHQ